MSCTPIPFEHCIMVRAADVAQFMGISRGQFFRKVREGELPKPIYPSGPGSHPRWSPEPFVRLKRVAAALPKPKLERMPRQVPLGPGVTHLYRHFDAAGQLLYVGISMSAVARLGEHKAASHWFLSIARVEVTAYGTRAAAAKAERIAIKREKPLHNIIHAEPTPLLVMRSTRS